MCPYTRDPVYVGQSVNPEKRYRSFELGRHKVDRKLHDWIKSFSNKELSPIIELLEKTTETKSMEREAYWIGRFRAEGYKLFNERLTQKQEQAIQGFARQIKELDKQRKGAA